jgi:hypothetical protein
VADQFLLVGRQQPPCTHSPTSHSTSPVATTPAPQPAAPPFLPGGIGH